MTNAELAELLGGLLTLRCPECGRRWVVRDEGPAVLYHRCHARRRVDPLAYAMRRLLGGRAEEERLAEASAVTDALADAVGPDSLLRPVDGEVD